MIYTAIVSIATTDKAQAIASSRVVANWVTLQADPANLASVYHGTLSVTSSTGQIISSGGGGGSPQYPPVADVAFYDLQHIFIVGTAGDIVRIMYGRR